MNDREQRGILIAAKCKISKKGKFWSVPSQSGSGIRYVVNPAAGTCTCPDHSEAGHRCKHLFAVAYTIKREYADDGSVTETETITLKQVRKNYPQKWSAYNAAQCQEQGTFQYLLHELCKSIPEPVETAIGRPRFPIRDAIFCATFKVFSTMSSRRFTSDLCDAATKGYIRKVPHFNSVLKAFDLPETGRLLTALIQQSAAPLASLESQFAIDSTGFSGCKFDKWFETKWAGIEPKSRREWVKCHAMIGCLTNVVTAVEVMGGHSADGPMLPTLMGETAKRFKIGDVCADAAYLSVANFEAIAGIGANAFIPFKSNSKAARPGVWNNAFYFYNLHGDEFRARYHQRSNVEATFSMIKRKFGDSVRAKNYGTMCNEVLAKILAHNLCCVIQSMEEFGIDPTFRLHTKSEPCT